MQSLWEEKNTSSKPNCWFKDFPKHQLKKAVPKGKATADTKGRSGESKGKKGATPLRGQLLAMKQN